jgi:hypothetical protein
VLFVLHQVILNPGSYYNTYYFLLDLSNGTVIWSSYTDYSTAPAVVIIEYAMPDHQASMTVDSLYSHVLFRIHNNHLHNFPKYKYGTNVFLNNRGRTLPYFGATYHSNNKRQIPSNISRKITQQIDSLVEHHFLSETTLPTNDRTSFDDTIGKGRSKKELNELLPILIAYFDYAYYSCKRFNPSLYGSVEYEFSITQDGRCRNIKISNSTINDQLLEFCISYIFRRISFGATYSGTGTTLVQTTITFKNRTFTKDFQEQSVSVHLK